MSDVLMKMITADMKLADLMKLPALQPYRRFMIYSPREDVSINQFLDARISDLAKIGWSPEGITAGLNGFLCAAAEDRVKLHFIYPEAECADDPNKKDVSLIQIAPVKPDPEKPFIILCAGGAYLNVCTMVEALPTARHMVDAGYTVFLMTYRVSVPKAAMLALDDLAAAVRWLENHAAMLGIDSARYAIGGYSAGANLISNWGCAHIGWKHYGAPKPLCLFPIYTYIDLKDGSDRKEDGGILSLMLGDDWREKLGQYSVAEHIDADYPPCYIVCGRDDAAVPCRNSEMMKEQLDAAGIPSILEEGEHAPHGFGDGTGTDVEGWPGRAVRFLEGLRQ